jgi:OPA family glycerol-3-phosphate transporter-like MFS transporter
LTTQFYSEPTPGNIGVLMEASMALLLVSLCLAAVIVLYFSNNPLNHTRKFMIRRFVNWFPLGMSYAFLYMGRYNLNVSKNAMGDMMTKEQFGIIFAAGTIVYGLSFLLNGPIVDKIGGKKGIIIATLGAAIMNLLMGGLTLCITRHNHTINLHVPDCRSPERGFKQII